MLKLKLILRVLALALVLGFVGEGPGGILAFGSPAQAQAAPDQPFVPSFWDPQRRIDRPDTSGLRLIRFVTDDEYPPFGFPGPDGGLTGFNVDIARAVCEELRVSCTIQARRFDTILDALVAGEADAAAASIANTPATRARVDFTAPYYRTPGRFAARRDFALDDLRPGTLAGAQVDVVAGTAHAAFIGKLFPAVKRVEHPDFAALLEALAKGEAPLIFSDGVSLAIWLNGPEGAACCAFRGGPYLDPLYFGVGVGIAVRKENPALRRALDYALARIAQRGVHAELYLKYFPVGFF